MADDTTAKVKGPASYFPAIEARYGRPVGAWLAMIGGSSLSKHMELVSWLKAEYGLGHGHANALVAYALAASTTSHCCTTTSSPRGTPPSPSQA